MFSDIVLNLQSQFSIFLYTCQAYSFVNSIDEKIYFCYIISDRRMDMAISDNLKRGTIELTILTLLQDGDMYGYEISQQLSDRSGGLYRILESSLYPSLYRLVEKGMISDHSEKVGKRRVRVYYHLEEQGRKYLEDLKHEYILHTAGVLKILQVDNIGEIANGIE